MQPIPKPWIQLPGLLKVGLEKQSLLKTGMRENRGSLRDFRASAIDQEGTSLGAGGRFRNVPLASKENSKSEVKTPKPNLRGKESDAL